MNGQAHHHQRFAAWVTVLFTALHLFSASAFAQGEPSCYGLTYEGNCDGDIAQWCENGEVIQVDCSDQGMVCAWNDEKNYYGCSEDTMESLTCFLPDDGFCESETTVVWCHDNGEKAELECGEGTICGWNIEESYFDCIPEDEPMMDSSAEAESSEQEEGQAEEGEWEPTTPEATPDHEEDPVVQAETVSNAEEWFGFSDESTQKTDSNEPLISPTADEVASEPGCRTTQRPLGTGFFLFLVGLLWIRKHNLNVST